MKNITSFFEWNSIENQYSPEFIKNTRCVKFSENEGEVTVLIASSSKDKKGILKQIHFGKEVHLVEVSDSSFSEFVGSIVECNQSFEEGKAETETGREVRFSLESINSEAPAVNIINAVCLEAVRKNASDIHIQRDEKNVRIRFRIDGVLHTVKKLDSSIYEALVTRLKVMACVNVAENRLPQDGSLCVSCDGSSVDLRISFLPGVYGESIVLRLFESNKKEKTLEELGFSESSMKVLKKIPRMKNGLVLVSGPTGSGKTTTLHALINQMDRESLKIITIEDPVERHIEGVDQIQVNEGIGLTFESLLRRILRQDPDVIMVGEIRDSETAALVLRAGLTGHLVLSTVHTTDSIGVIKRLTNLGADPYLVAGVLKISLAQRLVRKYENKKKDVMAGREAVSEIFVVDEELAEMIEKSASETEIKKSLRKKGFETMKEDGLKKVQAGITSLKEIEREVG